MASPKVKITYLDGTEKTVKATPRAQMMTEEKWGGILSQGTAIRATFYLGWAALRVAGQEPAEFEEWLDRIEDVDLVTSDGAQPDPTGGGEPTPAESSP